MGVIGRWLIARLSSPGQIEILRKLRSHKPMSDLIPAASIDEERTGLENIVFRRKNEARCTRYEM
jgi:hypothetical protein